MSIRELLGMQLSKPLGFTEDTLEPEVVEPFASSPAAWENAFENDDVPYQIPQTQDQALEELAYAGERSSPQALQVLKDLYDQRFGTSSLSHAEGLLGAQTDAELAKARGLGDLEFEMMQRNAGLSPEVLEGLEQFTRSSDPGAVTAGVQGETERDLLASGQQHDINVTKPHEIAVQQAGFDHESGMQDRQIGADASNLGLELANRLEVANTYGDSTTDAARIGQGVDPETGAPLPTTYLGMGLDPDAAATGSYDPLVEPPPAEGGGMTPEIAAGIVETVQKAAFEDEISVPEYIRKYYDQGSLATYLEAIRMLGGMSEQQLYDMQQGWHEQ